MNKKVVVFGGGTGMSYLLKGLKQYPLEEIEPLNEFVNYEDVKRLTIPQYKGLFNKYIERFEACKKSHKRFSARFVLTLNDIIEIPRKNLLFYVSESNDRSAVIAKKITEQFSTIQKLTWDKNFDYIISFDRKFIDRVLTDETYGGGIKITNKNDKSLIVLSHTYDDSTYWFISCRHPVLNSIF